MEKGYVTNQLNADKICSSWPFLMKDFYRKGYLSPNKGCTVNQTDYTSSVCGFTCNKDKISVSCIYFIIIDL